MAKGRPTLVASVAIATVLLSAIYLGSEFSCESSPRYDLRNAQVYYSTDDGATFVPGPASERTNPDRVVAHVFSTDGGRTTSVGYLERWLPAGVEAWKRLDAAIQANDGGAVARLQPAVDAGREVKRPGPGPWVNAAAPEAEEIQHPKGAQGEVDPDEVSAPPKS